jgi:hypothetical protein
MADFDHMDLSDDPSDLAALSDLVSGISRQYRSQTIVEIGSWAGMTALTMASVFPGNIYCVDTWQGTPGEPTRGVVEYFGPEHAFQTFCRNVGSRLFRGIYPCRGTSLQWAAVWPIKAALVFIDAQHDYESVKADILAWRPHVEPGGILCGHDYWDHYIGVGRAVEELIPAAELHKSGASVWWTKIPG